MKILKHGDQKKKVQLSCIGKIYCCCHCGALLKIGKEDRPRIRFEPVEIGSSFTNFGYVIECPSCLNDVRVMSDDMVAYTGINRMWDQIREKFPQAFKFCVDNKLFSEQTMELVKRYGG